MKKLFSILAALLLSTAPVQAQWVGGGFSVGGGGAALPQDLDTTDSPTFDGLTLTDELLVDSNGINFYRNLYNGGASGGVGAIGNWLTGGQFATSVTSDVCPIVGYGHAAATANLLELNASGGSGGDRFRVTGAGALEPAVDLGIAYGGTGSSTGAGLVGVGVTNINGVTTLNATDGHLVLCDMTGGNYTVTLPAANTCGGVPWTFFLTGTNTLTISRAGSDTINTTLTSRITAGAGAVYTLVSDGVSNFIALSGLPFDSDATQTAGRPLCFGAANGSATPTANCSGITGTGALSSGSIASGFGTIATANTIEGSKLTAATDHIVVSTLGKTLEVQEGSGGMAGVAAAMSSGTVTVTNANVLTGDRIILSRVSGTAGNAGFPSYTISNATSFTINSTNGADDSVYAYLIVRDAP